MKVLSASRSSSAVASLAMVSSEQSTLNQASHTNFSWLNMVPEIKEVKRRTKLVLESGLTIGTEEGEFLEWPSGLGHTHVVHLTESLLVWVKPGVEDQQTIVVWGPPGLTLHWLFLRRRSWCPGGCRSPAWDSPGPGSPVQKSGRKPSPRESRSEKPGEEQVNSTLRTAANISLGNSPLPKTAWLSDCIWGTWLVFTSPEHYLSDSFILFSSHGPPVPAVMTRTENRIWYSAQSRRWIKYRVFSFNS